MSIPNDESCLLEQYISFLEDTEPPEQFHRWSFLSAIAARLGRKIWFQHGHSKIYPNMFVLLVGAPATRKSSSIKIARKILEDSGYLQFSFSKSSKQKFLLDWSEGALGGQAPITAEQLLDMPIITNPKLNTEATSECYIAQDEFIDFIGQGNFDFITLLTTLWDNLDKYDERLKNSTSVSLPNPTLNVLGGITPLTLSMALPQEANGSGFLSRLILVYSNPSGKSIAFPTKPSEKLRQQFIQKLASLANLQGEMQLTPDGKALLTDIYDEWKNDLDVKLEYYAGRRLTHLIKLCMIMAALRNSLTISSQDIIKAHSILHYTECSMSMALQNLGTAKNLEATSKVFQFISRHEHPVTVGEIYRNTITYFEKLTDLALVLNNLQDSKRISVKDGQVYALKLDVQDLGATTDLHKYIKEYKGAKHDRLELVD